MKYYIDECDKEPHFSCHPQNDFYFSDCSISTIQDENYYTDSTTCAKNGAVEQMQPNITNDNLDPLDPFDCPGKHITPEKRKEWHAKL